MSTSPYAWFDPRLWLNLPFSGSVDQNYHPLTNWFSPQIDIQYVGNAPIEREITGKVAGYGSQLGTLTDVLMELTRDQPASPAVTKMREMAERIERVKAGHREDVREAAKHSLDRLAQTDRDGLRQLLVEYAERYRDQAS